MTAVRWCGLMLQTSHVAWSVCLCFCPSACMFVTRVWCAKSDKPIVTSFRGRIHVGTQPCFRWGSRLGESICSSEGWQHRRCCLCQITFCLILRYYFLTFNCMSYVWSCMYGVVGGASWTRKSLHSTVRKKIRLRRYNSATCFPQTKCTSMIGLTRFFDCVRENWCATTSDNNGHYVSRCLVNHWRLVFVFGDGQ